MKRFYGQSRQVVELDVDEVMHPKVEGVEIIDDDDPFSNPYNHFGAVTKRQRVDLYGVEPEKPPVLSFNQEDDELDCSTAKFAKISPSNQQYEAPQVSLFDPPTYGVSVPVGGYEEEVSFAGDLEDLGANRYDPPAYGVGKLQSIQSIDPDVQIGKYEGSYYAGAIRSEIESEGENDHDEIEMTYIDSIQSSKEEQDVRYEKIEKKGKETFDYLKLAQDPDEDEEAGDEGMEIDMEEYQHERHEKAEPKLRNKMRGKLPGYPNRAAQVSFDHESTEVRHVPEFTHSRDRAQLQDDQMQSDEEEETQVTVQPRAILTEQEHFQMQAKYLQSLVNNWMGKILVQSIEEAAKPPLDKEEANNFKTQFLIQPQKISLGQSLKTYLTFQEEESLTKPNHLGNQYHGLAELDYMNPKTKFLKPPSLEHTKFGSLAAGKADSLLRTPNVGFDHQAKRYPRYKNVRSLWHFDYEAEEKKRFAAGNRGPPRLMWDPSKLSQEQIKNYLQTATEIYGKRSGMTEEIALSYLVYMDYNVIKALFSMQNNPQEIKEKFISTQNRNSEKQESIAYILSLQAQD